MSRPLCFLSFAILLTATPAHARWSVELRPLDTRPFQMDFKPLVVLHAESNLSHFEGLGVELPPGRQTVVFEAALGSEPGPRELDLNVGYLTAGKLPKDAAGCEVALEVTGGAPARKSMTLPLRSIEPSTLPEAELKAHYDYLTPEVRFPVAGGMVGLKATVQRGCTAGKVVLLNPKVWRKRSDEAPKRLIWIPSDSLSADWFEEGRRFMPFLQDYFARPGARLSTRAVTVSTNTYDTTTILTRMRYQLREAPLLESSAQGAGLVPAFLEAGYEVLSLNSNLLLSTAWQPSGFRYLFNLNATGTPVNEAHVEILAGMMLDWLQRHPDHDVFLFTWLDATHYAGPAPRVRVDMPNNLLPRGERWSQHWLEQQARSMSYTDLALETFLDAPLVRSSDLFFFSDHGLNFRTLEHPLPLWGECPPKEAPSNWHLEPEEVRIPAAMRVHGYDPGELGVEASLLDWAYSVLKHHNPDLDLRGFQGRELTSVKADDPLITVSHGSRGSIRVAGTHVRFEASCSAARVVDFYYPPELPGTADLKRSLYQVLTAHDFGGYRELEVSVFHGSAACPVTIELPPALLESGAPAPTRLEVDPTRWFTSLRVFVPAVLGDAEKHLVVVSPDKCAEVQIGFVRRSSGGRLDLATSGLWSMAHLAGNVVGVGEAPVVRVLHPKVRYYLVGDRLTTGAAKAGKRSELSKEVRAAMKQWGYIQDDDAQ